MGNSRTGVSITGARVSPRAKIQLGVGHLLFVVLAFSFAILFSTARLVRHGAATTISSFDTDYHEAGKSQKKVLRASPPPPPPRSRQISGETGDGTNNKHPPCVGSAPPNATAVASLLRSEHLRAGVPVHSDDWYENYGALYSTTYAFVSGFERRKIPIFLVAGSHLGALRHHGIIPFKEKDVDFAVFSLDIPRMKGVINDILAELGLGVKCQDVKPPANFGVNVKISSLSHFFDFWFYDDNFKGRGEVKCVGPLNSKEGASGCTKWYRNYFKMDPPTFPKEDWVPPARQVFGTHRVPVPATSAFLEGKQYNFEDWNITCGGHYSWKLTKSGTHIIPASERQCAQYYDDHPFVFKVDGGREELRQGGRVLHVSSLTAPCASGA